MNIIFDIILLTLLVISFIIGYRKGFVKTIWKIAALVITIVLVMALKAPAANMLMGTRMAENIHTGISENVRIPQGGGVNIAENLNLPEFMQAEVNDRLNSTQDAISSVNATTADVLTGIFVTIIACVVLFIIIRLILMAVYMIINGVTKVPVIRGINRLAGGLLAVVNMIFVIFLLLSLFSLYAPADSNMYEIIEKTYVVKYLYNYNILLQLFMKI